MTPIELLTTWIIDEKSIGAEYAQHVVLSSHGLDGAPHGRVVAIREITKDSILLFTQKRTRKVSEIKNNNQVALTFWFERYAREVIVEGDAVIENLYQQRYDHTSQLEKMGVCLNVTGNTAIIHGSKKQLTGTQVDVSIY